MQVYVDLHTYAGLRTQVYVRSTAIDFMVNTRWIHGIEVVEVVDDCRDIPLQLNRCSVKRKYYL